MNFPTLQQVLENNYGIKERIWVEGKFIAFLDKNQSATCLISLGLGQRNMYIARVVFAGPGTDYELLSLVPLSLVSFAYNNALKMLKVRSKFKVTQMFQFCTNQNGDKVWDDITTYIKYMGINKTPVEWIHRQLTQPYGDDNDVACVDVDGGCCESLLTQFYPANSVATLTCQYLDQLDKQAVQQSTARIHAYRSASFPNLRQMESCNKSFGSHCRRHSMGCADIKFDNFANVASTTLTRSNSGHCSSTMSSSADDITCIHNKKLNVSNNYAAPSVTETRNVQAVLSKTGLSDKIKRLFCCRKGSLS